jgi:hypothetical protein
MASKNLQIYKEDYLPHQWDFLTIQKRQPQKKLNFLCGGMGINVYITT